VVLLRVFICPTNVLPPESPNITIEHYLRAGWLEFRPDYWQELERVQRDIGISTLWHFGRATIVAGAYPANHYPLLGETPSFVPAFREGWLEAIDCNLFHADQVKSLLAWPESHHALPLHLNTLRCQAEGFDDVLMQGPPVASWPARHHARSRGNRVSVHEAVQRAGPERALSVAPGLEEDGTQLSHPGTATPPPGAEGSYGRSQSSTDEQIKELAASPKLQCLYLCGLNVTDNGLTAVAEIRTLRTLVVNSLRVSRAGFYALREVRPDLRVVATDDTLELPRPGVIHYDARSRLTTTVRAACGTGDA